MDPYSYKSLTETTDGDNFPFYLKTKTKHRFYSTPV